MAFGLKATQQVNLEIIGVTDRKGNPTSLQNPVWSTTDDLVASLTVTEGTTTRVVAGNLGTASITVTADADLGDGVKEISSMPFDIEVVPGDAEVINIQASTPTDQ